jgi:hypothetical protein
LNSFFEVVGRLESSAQLLDEVSAWCRRVLGCLLNKHSGVLLDTALLLSSDHLCDFLPVGTVLSHCLDERFLLVLDELLFRLGGFVRLENLQDEFGVRHLRVLLRLMEQVVRVLGHLQTGFGCDSLRDDGVIFAEL